MTDDQLKTLIRAELLALLASQQDPVFPIIEGFPPTKQGRVVNAYYYHVLNEPRRGWQRRTYSYDAETGLKIEEAQSYEMTLQFNAFTDPNSAVTAGDAVKLLQMLVASGRFAQSMAAHKVAVQQPTAARTAFFNNDRNQYEPDLSFDVTVSYNRSIVFDQPAIDLTDFDLFRV